MHLREAETLQLAESGANLRRKKEEDVRSHQKEVSECSLNLEPQSELKTVLVSIPDGLALESFIDALLSSWFVLAQRYQRDVFQGVAWCVEGVQPHVRGTISGHGMQASRGHILADLISNVRQERSKDLASALTESRQLILKDSIGDEWTLQLRVEIQANRASVSATSQTVTLSDYSTICHLQHFQQILKSALCTEQVPVAELLEVSTSELEQIWRWNTPLPSTLETCMHDIISEKARSCPRKHAIEAWDGSLTYAQVEHFSTALAQNLLLMDENHGIVPVLFEKSRWTVVGLLAVMKAGKCFALLDPAQPEGRLQTIIEQTRATLVVTSELQTNLAASVAPSTTIVPVSQSKIDKIYLPFLKRRPDTSLPTVSPSTPLYVQFTSGSTGQPKGCVITHSQFTSGAIPRAQTVGYRAHSRVLDFASYAFDVSIDSMLCTLATGATLCTPSDEERMNNLNSAIREFRVTWAGMTPSVARTLDSDIMKQLERLALGGESISVSEATEWGKKTRIVNCYGPSECTVGATYNADVAQKPYITMGRGTGAATWLVEPSDHNRLVPIGAVGELLIEGPIVGNGYLNNLEKTKDVFIEDPDFLVEGCANQAGRRGRMYKTGDLVRYDADGFGELIFVGRQDQQVKLRGQRIELAEIEYNMQKHLPPDSFVASEIIKPGGSGEPVLVAFVQPNDSETEKSGREVFGKFSSEYRKSLINMADGLKKDLPIYMIPSAYIPLLKMPLLVSCKTDRKRLREIGSSITRQDLRTFNAAISRRREPDTEMEVRLRSLWAKVLGGDEDFGVNDSFFAMGGDSLRAMRLVAAARAEGISLTVPDIMMNSTLSAMAKKAKVASSSEADDIHPFSLLPGSWDAQTARAEVANLCEVDPTYIEDVLPCTPLQEGLMALSAKFADAYVAQRVVELPLSVVRQLADAFHKTMATCPILRTRIINAPGRGLYQVIVKGDRSRRHGINLEEYLEEDREDRMELGTALFRYGLIEPPGSGKGFLVTSIHHSIYDGWSMPLVVEHVNRTYNGTSTTRAADFRHFIRYLTRLDLSESQQYWRTLLDGASPHQFPGIPRRGYVTHADSLLEHYVTVKPASQTRHTVATIIRAAWAYVSALYLWRSDVVFGETLTGRSAPIAGVEQIEGPMITTVPFRAQTSPHMTIAKYLDSIHEQTVATMPHEHLGLQNIRRVSRDAREACELRTGLVLHPKEDDDLAFRTDDPQNPANGLVPANDEEAAKEALKFNTYALMLVCTLDAEGFLVMASFDSKCISSAAMERVLKLLDKVVIRLASDDSTLLGDIPGLENDEELDAQSLRAKDAIDDHIDSDGVTEGTVQKKVAPMQKPPSNSAEKICAILACILGVPKKDINLADSFFDLGGDSISAMRLVSEARAQGLNFTVSQVFETASIASLLDNLYYEKQARLHQLLSCILDIDTNDINGSDTFFDLGGDSIAAMRLVSEARAEGLKLTVAQIFQGTTVEALAEGAEDVLPHFTSSTSIDKPYSALPEDAGISSAVIEPLLRHEDWEIINIYPTRPLQKLAVEGTVKLPRYSIRYELIHFTVPIDHARLQQACQELIGRNEVLRTVFVEHNGTSFAVALKDLEAPFNHIALPEESHLYKSAQQFTQRDIAADVPLGSSFVTFTLFTNPAGESVLAFRISHAQYDEICLPLIYAQLAALYTGSSIPESQPFSRHVNYVINHSIERSKPYWRDLLSGSQMSIFRPTIPLTNRNPTDVYAEFDISARPKGITIGTLPTAAWALVLANRISSRDLVFGEVVTGRNIGVPGADRIVGPTWQYIPFRVSFEEEWTYRDLLEFVQDQHIASSSHECMGLEEIVSQCTNWDPETVTWFDSVVHQAPEWVESMDFGGLEAKFETVYPHAEPLREWKCQAFVKDGGRKLGIEIVTFEEWRGVADEVLNEVGRALEKLVEHKADDRIFGGSA